MRTFKLVMKGLLALLFVGAGVNHFLRADFYVKAMPPYLPWHRELVYLSGVCEIVLGALLMVRRLTALAAWGSIALLIAVFPANIHMALNAEQYPAFSPVLLWLRLPLQGVLIAWAYWFTRPFGEERRRESPGSPAKDGLSVEGEANAGPETSSPP